MSGKASNAGQSTIEFALSMVFLIGFTLFFFQVSLVMAFGNYVHYATFLAARAYLSAGPTAGDQHDRATGVIVEMLKKSVALPGVDRIPVIAKGYDSPNETNGTGVPGLRFDSPLFQGNKDDRNYSWMQGIRYSFRSRIFLIPIGISSTVKTPGLNDWILESESYLGREDSFAECMQEMKSRAGGRDFYFDNGC